MEMVTCPQCQLENRFKYYSPLCVYCHFDMTEKGVSTCHNCEFKFNPFYDKSCPCCGVPLAMVICKSCGSLVNPSRVLKEDEKEAAMRAEGRLS